MTPFEVTVLSVTLNAGIVPSANVGGDAYNQTLSEARAKAIVAWLTQHGIAADRLTDKGFGKTRPIADNTTDAGRAKNRRVEIADPNCTAAGK